MLIITNRIAVAGASDADAFSSAFAVDSPNLSVADATLNQGGGNAASDWTVSRLALNATDATIKARLGEVIKPGKRVLVYVHGNGYDYLECLKRCEALHNAFKLDVIGFSWPSEGHKPQQNLPLPPDCRKIAADKKVTKVTFFKWLANTRSNYLQAKKNAVSSAVALTKALRLINDVLAQTGDAMAGTLSIHSLGNHLFWQAVTQNDANDAITHFSNVLLLAPCLDARDQEELLDPLLPQRGVYVTFNNDDWVLAGAQIADGDLKLGLKPGNTNSSNLHVRYIDFEGACKGAIGHRYFIDPKDLAVATTQRLFKRTFSGEDDLQLGEPDTKVYPFHCDTQGRFCRMGLGTVDNMGGN